MAAPPGAAHGIPVSDVSTPTRVSQPAPGRSMPTGAADAAAAVPTTATPAAANATPVVAAITSNLAMSRWQRLAGERLM
jgi:ApbE superfamily uncharacterized protein (UPF0280 family)